MDFMQYERVLIERRSGKGENELKRREISLIEKKPKNSGRKANAAVLPGAWVGVVIVR